MKEQQYLSYFLGVIGMLIIAYTTTIWTAVGVYILLWSHIVAKHVQPLTRN